MQRSENGLNENTELLSSIMISDLSAISIPVLKLVDSHEHLFRGSLALLGVTKGGMASPEKRELVPRHERKPTRNMMSIMENNEPASAVEV